MAIKRIRQKKHETDIIGSSLRKKKIYFHDGRLYRPAASPGVSFTLLYCMERNHGCMGAAKLFRDGQIAEKKKKYHTCSKGENVNKKKAISIKVGGGVGKFPSI